MNTINLLTSKSAALIVLLASTAPTFAQVAPPKTERREVKDTYFGQTISDSYRWLENSKSDETQKWVKAQTDYSRAYLNRLPMRDEILKRLNELSDVGTRVGGIQRRGNLYFYRRRASNENDFRIYVREGLTGAEKLLVGPDKIASDGRRRSINGYSASQDGKYLSYVSSVGGSENGELRVIETATGRDMGEFVSAQFRRGSRSGAQILGTGSFREMHRVRWVEENWTTGTGLGFSVRRIKDKTYVGHGGGYPGNTTQTLIHLGDKVGVIVLTNTNDSIPADIAEQLTATVGQAVAKAATPMPVVAAWDPAWERFVGLYRGRGGDTQVVLLNKRLVNDTERNGGPKRVASVTQPTNGTVAVTDGGATVTYKPKVGYCNSRAGGTADTFTYSLNSGLTATVAMTVTCVSPPPLPAQIVRASTEQVTSSTSPRRDRTRPYTFTTTGRIVPPAGYCAPGVSPTPGAGNCITLLCPPGVKDGKYCIRPPHSAICAGVVTVRFRKRTTTVSSRNVKVRPDCTYRSRVTFRTRLASRRGVLTSRARFQGNQLLQPRNSATRSVRAG